MKALHSIVACAVLLISVTAANATTVSWANGQPQGGTGQVSGSGTYVMDNGWTVQSCIMVAIPKAGGTTASAPGLMPANGKWGTITIKNLTAGQYTIIATVIFKDSNSQTQQINTPIAVVNVM